jgi:hypothetical protein
MTINKRPMLRKGFCNTNAKIFRNLKIFRIQIIVENIYRMDQNIRVKLGKFYLVTLTK